MSAAASALAPVSEIWLESAGRRAGKRDGTQGGSKAGRRTRTHTHEEGQYTHTCACTKGLTPKRRTSSLETHTHTHTDQQHKGGGGCLFGHWRQQDKHQKHRGNWQLDAKGQWLAVHLHNDATEAWRKWPQHHRHREAERQDSSPALWIVMMMKIIHLITTCSTSKHNHCIHLCDSAEPTQTNTGDRSDTHLPTA